MRCRPAADGLEGRGAGPMSPTGQPPHRPPRRAGHPTGRRPPRQAPHYAAPAQCRPPRQAPHYAAPAQCRPPGSHRIPRPAGRRPNAAHWAPPTAPGFTLCGAAHRAPLRSAAHRAATAFRAQQGAARRHLSPTSPASHAGQVSALARLTKSGRWHGRGQRSRGKSGYRRRRRRGGGGLQF